MQYLYIKRFFDFMFSFFALIILSPIFLIIIIAIKLDSKGPVLFIQKRIGIHKTHFVEDSNLDRLILCKIKNY